MDEYILPILTYRRHPLRQTGFRAEPWLAFRRAKSGATVGSASYCESLLANSAKLAALET